MSSLKYVVFDIETTGLDPDRDQILEVGAIAVDAELNELARFERVAFFGAAGRERWDPFVQDMHTKNGLWDACADKAHTLSLFELDVMLAGWLRDLGAEPRSVILAGHSVHFDQSFVKAQLPQTTKLLSHRLLDFTGVSLFLQACGLPNYKPDSMPHRALPDCELELEVGRKMRDAIVELQAPTYVIRANGDLSKLANELGPIVVEPAGAT